MSNTYPEAICDPSIKVELTAAGIFLDAALSNTLRTASRTTSSSKHSAWAHLGQLLNAEECPPAYGTKAQLPVARPPTVEIGHRAHWAEMPGANRRGSARPWMPCSTSWFMEVRMEGEILSSALLPKLLALRKKPLCLCRMPFSEIHRYDSFCIEKLPVVTVTERKWLILVLISFAFFWSIRKPTYKPMWSKHQGGDLASFSRADGATGCRYTREEGQSIAQDSWIRCTDGFRVPNQHRTTHGQ